MEVHLLRLEIGDADLSSLIARHLPDDGPLENVAVRIQPGGLFITGVYPILVNVAFESWWRLGVEGGKVWADLTRLKAFGMPAMVFKSAILKAIEDISGQWLWIEIRGERIHVDVEAALGRHAIPGRVHLRRLDCGDGTLLIEAGKSI